MKNKILLVLSGSFLAFTFLQCSKTDIKDGNTAGYCDGIASTYNTDAEPIITTHCQLGADCHSPGSTNAGGELTDYNKIFAKRAAIRAAVYSGVMPQSGSLTLAEKKKIICWIDNGAPDN